MLTGVKIDESLFASLEKLREKSLSSSEGRIVTIYFCGTGANSTMGEAGDIFFNGETISHITLQKVRKVTNILLMDLVVENRYPRFICPPQSQKTSFFTPW